MHPVLFTYHAVAVGPGPLSLQSGRHLEPTVLLPVGPTGSTEPTLHVWGSPGVPLVGAAGYTHTRVVNKVLNQWFRPPAESPTSSTYCSNFHRPCRGRGSARGSARGLGVLTPLRLLLRSEELVLRCYSAGWGSACYWGEKQEHKGAIRCDLISSWFC